ncbi:HAD-IA family hydrolase [Spirulina sp. CS-785/01]|uniref:HAD-IA family hydrolase n=1 Tax=Spirulina sp. CS-785/01 TaxID=3021716 RepID=UPI00232D606A|nr:HAD-IA family hydrolase [Spirulina sp. CS-785/01]MDB9314712.1 HAD-IA family hydrolase [Spirulina sp. CS-785/01]
MAIEWIIFDFDGTIADTHRPFINILNRLSDEFGYDPVKEEDIPKLRGLSSQEIVQKADISLFKIPFLLKKAKQELNKDIIHVLPITGMDQAIQELYQTGYHLGILTSNIQENVTIFLQKNNLSDLFEFVHSGNTLFGKDRLLKKIFKQYNINPDVTVYVGDETRDIDAAKKSGIRVISVTWGFNSQDILAEHNPDFLVSNVEDFIKLIN